ncbi:MAG: polyprenyl synthetase family protein [Pseudomonadota bacterium]
MFTDDLAAASRAAQDYLADTLADWGDLPVVAGMRYTLDGGKGLRAFLVIEGARLHGVDVAQARVAAAAIEALHAYSLVHDDLPAMDDDDTRRGQPTVHVKWDEATAILVGDALQALAFELLAEHASPDAAVRARLAGSLARAAGAQGMVLGQAQDIAAETADAPLTLGQITALQRNKTGALIEWAGVAGAVLAGAETGPLQTYSEKLGLAFQIADDILDVEGDAAAMGKAAQKDAAAGKATFVSILGLETARARAQQLVDEACEALAPYGAAAQPLKDAAQFVVSRSS